MFCILYMFILSNLAIGLDLDLQEYNITIDGHVYTRYGIEGKGKGWTYQDNIGYVSINSFDSLSVTYHNSLRDNTIVHGHGLTPFQQYDGVPYVDAQPISPGNSAKYEYGLQTDRYGTYFLHTHYGLQHTRGLATPVIIKSPAPAGYPLAEALGNARDVVMFLEDFCDYYPDAGPNQNLQCNDPWGTFGYLSKAWDVQVNTYNYSECGEPADGTDVGYRYQLANGKTIDDPVIVNVNPKQWIRLRIVNGGSMSSFKLRLGELSGVAVMTDGRWVVPNMKSNVFWIAVAQRLDILVQIPADGKVFPIIAQEIGSGYERYHQSGIVMTIGGAKPPTYSRNAPDATGVMGVSQEMAFRAWFPLSQRNVDVEFNVALTGDNGFHGINKNSFQLPPVVSTYTPNPHPLIVKKGQRVCILIKNYNSDAHSMHLHGHSFQVVEIDGKQISGAMRDTVMTARGGCRTIKVCFDADHPGEWPFHCHMSFHLAAGMLTTVKYVD